MKERTFKVERVTPSDRSDQKAEAGATASLRRVTLILGAEGSFRLIEGWLLEESGERQEELRIYVGRFEEDQQGVRCRSTTVTTTEYTLDHGLQTGERVSKTEPSSRQIEFEKISEDELRCPIDRADLDGAVMRRDPQPFFDPA